MAGGGLRWSCSTARDASAPTASGFKSFKKVEGDDGPPPDDPGNPTVNLHGETRTNATHASTTDPDARLARKGPGKEAKLSYTGHILMENRNGPAVDVAVPAGDVDRRARGGH